jgi:hypothetical protein
MNANIVAFSSGPNGVENTGASSPAVMPLSRVSWPHTPDVGTRPVCRPRLPASPGLSRLSRSPTRFRNEQTTPAGHLRSGDHDRHWGGSYIWEGQFVSPTANMKKMATMATIGTKSFRISEIRRRRWLPRLSGASGASRTGPAFEVQPESGLHLDSTEAR